MSKRVRAPVIQISTPKDGAVSMVRLQVERITVEDGVVTQTVPGVAEIYKPLPVIAMDVITVASPVTGQSITLTVAEIAKLVEAAAAKYMAEHFGVVVGDDLKVWVE